MVPTHLRAYRILQSAVNRNRKNQRWTAIPYIGHIGTVMQTSSTNSKPIAVIACGVLALDCKHLAETLDVDLQLHFLPGGLHRTPTRLREELQHAIDRIDHEGGVERIVIGYGLCGRGTVGIHARRTPLVIPLVHDCIALFLGSDAAYRQQFAQAPGTYYLSAGWVEEKHDTESGMGSGPPTALHASSDANLQKRFGSDNAAFIKDFMQSWTRNYTRSAFIDTGVGGSKEQYAQKAESLARAHAWDYERLEGTHDLLQEAFLCEQSSDHVLVVPPGAFTTYDALRSRLAATQHASGQAEGTSTPSPPGAKASGDDAAGTDYGDLHPRGVGIGIDAGGTYTDVVLFDFDRKVVLAKNKALTTHWDYSHGIRNALQGLDAARCREASLVAVSTTLATNAIVEDRGQPVGLLIMPPCGWTTLEGFQHKPVEIIRGRLNIDGTESEPIDPNQIRATARHLAEKGVTAFAVGGYASHVNPAHELAVKRYVQEETGMLCTCSHELSSALHYRVRAETAALNARIVPCLEALLQRITESLQHAGIDAPIMVVRSDGSFMSIAAACEKPLETMLSGPAASAAGAGWLAQERNALVVDIGGTTTDTAILRHGLVDLNPEGASVGGWQTHIRALDLHTAGLGGDSCIRMHAGTITMGPDRVIPLSWTGMFIAGAEQAFADWNAFAHPPEPSDLILLVRTAKQAGSRLSDREQQMLEALEQRPYTPAALADLLAIPHASLLPVKRLLQQRLIQYSGFTPTDALHATGELAHWHVAVAKRATLLCAGGTSQTDAWLQSILQAFETRLATEIARKGASTMMPMEQLDAESGLQDMLGHLVRGANADGFRLQLQLPWPVIGIGAPAARFLPHAAERLDAAFVVPEHADVANAVGAIIGTISVRHAIGISSKEDGTFRLSGAPDAPLFTTIEAATEWARTYLAEHLTEQARAAGCPHPTVAITIEDATAASADGTPVFIARNVLGHATGAPIAPDSSS